MKWNLLLATNVLKHLSNVSTVIVDHSCFQDIVFLKSLFFFFFLFKIKVIVLCFYGDFYGCPAMRKEWINKLCYTSWVNNILHTLSAIWLPLTRIPSLRMWQVHGTQLHQINKCILLTTWLENSIILQFSNRYRQS